MPTGKEVVHSTLVNDPTDPTKHNLHAPGYVVENKAAISAIATGAPGDFAFQEDTGQLYKFFNSVFTLVAPNNNINASVSPSSSNDNTQGYSVGSLWFDQVAGLAWTCFNSSTSAAVWKIATGDVFGPASSTVFALARFQDTTGRLIENSTVTLDNSGNLSNVLGITSGPGNLTLTAGADHNLSLVSGGTGEITLNTTTFVQFQQNSTAFLNIFQNPSPSPNEAVLDFSLGNTLFNKIHVIGNNGMLFDLTGASGNTIIAFQSPGGIVRYIGTGLQFINTALDISVLQIGSDNFSGTPTQAQMNTGLPLVINTAGLLVKDNGSASLLLNMFLNTSPSPNETTLDFTDNGNNFDKVVFKVNNGLLFDLSTATGNTVISFKSPAGIIRSIGTGFQIMDTTQNVNVMVFTASGLGTTPVQAQISSELPLLIQGSGILLAPSGSQPVKIDGASLQWRDSADNSVVLSIGMDSAVTPTISQIVSPLPVSLATGNLTGSITPAGMLSLDVSAQIRSTKLNVTAGAPGVGNDNTQGYSQFSQWIDSTGPDHYVCLDASTGAAVWKKTTP